MKNCQSGQAMMAGLVILLTVFGAIIFTLQIGRIVKEKSLLLVATDAAAFSVAQEHASLLNTFAYLNRAHIAHQIALAHLVTLASAEKFREKQSVQSAANNPPAALIGVLFGPHHAAAYVASNIGGAGGALFSKTVQLAYRWHDQTIHELIARSQQALLDNWENRRDQVFMEALTRNLYPSQLNTIHPSMFTVNRQLKSHLTSTLHHAGVEWKVVEDQTYKKIVIKSGVQQEWMQMLDAVVKTHTYLSDRNYSVKNKWVVHPRCPWRRHVLRRNGGTRINEQGIWRSDDSLAFHAVRSNHWIGCYMREYPMGWSRINPGAEGQGSIQAPRNFSKEAYWKWLSKQDGSTKALKHYGENRLAKSWSMLDPISFGGKGHGSHTNLITDSLDPEAHSISIKFEVSKRLFPQPVRKMSQDGKHYSSLHSNFLTETLRVGSRAESITFFSHPGEKSLSENFVPSLFKPFWQGKISTATR